MDNITNEENYSISASRLLELLSEAYDRGYKNGCSTGFKKAQSDVLKILKEEEF